MRTIAAILAIAAAAAFATAPLDAQARLCKCNGWSQATAQQ
jgi:hypothetical protein